MKKQVLVLSLVIIILSTVLALTFFNEKPTQAYVVLDGKNIFVEVADTSDTRSKGLMFRDQLCEECGMFFVFQDEDFHVFWMKNTPMPLDIIFINSDLEVVDLVHAMPCREEPCKTYPPDEPCLYVLETGMEKFNESVIGRRVQPFFISL